MKFFDDHSAIDEPNVQAESDRYIARQGQALAGEARCDVRAFHGEVLGAGALISPPRHPLHVAAAVAVDFGVGVMFHGPTVDLITRLDPGEPANTSSGLDLGSVTMFLISVGYTRWY